MDWSTLDCVMNKEKNMNTSDNEEKNRADTSSEGEELQQADTLLDDILAEIEKTDKEREKEKAELESLGEKFDEPWTHYAEDDGDEPIDNLLAQIPDILAHLEGMEVIEHTNAEEQFKDWEDYDHLLEVKNPDGGESLEIDVGEDDRFSLFYGGWHAHFDACKRDYFDMLETIRKILSSEVCAVRVSSGKSHWLGCDLTHRMYTSSDASEIVLRRTLLCKEFEDEVHATGGRISVTYWDSRRNSSFVFEARDK